MMGYLVNKKKFVWLHYVNLFVCYAKNKFNLSYRFKQDFNQYFEK